MSRFAISGTTAALLGAAALIYGSVAPFGFAHAQDVKLRFHTFVPAVSSSYKNYEGWVKTVEEQSGGRIEFEMYPSMQLGGKPSALYNQVKDGIVDVVYTLAGYTPGQFPRTEVFELPFVSTTSYATSMAATEFYPKWLKEEYEAVHPLVLHAPGPPLFHVRGEPIRTLEDLAGRKVRTPSKPIGDMLAALGATPVGIPGASITEAMLRGVVDAMVFPWAIARATKLIDAAESHTIALTHNSILLALMNKNKYQSIPAELRKVIDETTGLTLASKFGKQWAKDDEPGIARAKELGHEIITLPEEERARWKERSEPVIDAWVEKMNQAGHPGRELVEDARALIAKHEGEQ